MMDAMSAPNETIKARLQDDLTAAIKSRDEVVVSTIRMVRAAIQNAEVAGSQAIELDDAQIEAVLRSEAKKRSEAAEVYEQAGRLELASKERAELAVIEGYLPAAIGDDEMAVIVEQEVAVAAAAGNAGPRAMGVVIKAVRERAGASADGAKVASLVKSALG